MHIPDAMLQGSICPVTATLSAAGIVAASYYGLKADHKPKASYFGAITALIFAGQMMNFPVMHGTSGHLLGGVLAASLLGTPFGVLAVALVVVIQSLVFSDGGVTVLGANIFNMAILGAGVGGMLRSRLAARWHGVQGKNTATAVSAWLSVMLASFAVSVELALDGQIAFLMVLPGMLGTHALIGLGEAVITVACCLLLAPYSAPARSKGQVAVPLTAAVMVALLFSPFASGLPDGLEWIAEKYNFLHESTPAFVGLFSDYAVPLFRHERLATGIAGLLGVTVSFGVAWIISRILTLSSIKKRIA